MLKRMDHTAYPASLRRKSDAELWYIIRDASEAASAQPDGLNAGYYLDEVHYANAELQRRFKGRCPNRKALEVAEDFAQACLSLSDPAACRQWALANAADFAQ